jgi:hypothetical protein
MTHWVVDPHRKVIEYFDDSGHNIYEVDLNTMTSSAAVLEWIVQLRHQAWASSADIGELVLLLDERLDLQRNFCSDGVEVHGAPPSADST